MFGLGQAAGSPYSGVITQFVQRAIAGQALTVKGDGGQTRDFVSVRDIARGLQAAIDLAVRMEPGQTEVTICVAAACVDPGPGVDDPRLAGSGVPPVFDAPRAGDIRHSRGDPAHARACLGFEARETLEQGLTDLIRRAKARNNRAGVVAD